MYYTREQIRSFIRCPQLGSEDYGEWGALRLEQRLAINSMLDQLDSAEVYIRQLEKENEFWKEYKEKLDKLDTEDFIFKHELENHIPKSVIREKIEELEANKNMNIMARSSQIDILKELLGGSNE